MLNQPKWLLVCSAAKIAKTLEPDSSIPQKTTAPMNRDGQVPSYVHLK